MADLQRTALVLVDVVAPGPGGPAQGDPDVFDRLGTVLQVARASEIKVIHVWSAAPGDPPPPTHPSIEPRPGEPVLPNRGAGAWSGAELSRTLVAGNVESIVLAGPAGGPAWWPTLEETAARPVEVQVLSDRRPEHDAEARRLMERPAGFPPATVVDAGSWIAGLGRQRRPGRRRSRRAVLLGTLVAVVGLIVAGIGYIDHQAGGYYEFSPGSAPTVTSSVDCKVRSSSGNDLSLADGAPCARLLVPSDRAHSVTGRLFMVDVLVGPASPFDYALSKLHLLNTVHPGNELVPAAAVLGTTPAAQLGCQDAQQMTSSTQDAAVAALDRLGYGVKENHLGAQIIQVSPGTAADTAGVHCDDVVTAVNGTAVHTAEDLVAAIHGLHPGDRAKVQVNRTGADGKPTTVAIDATLTGTPAQPAADGRPAQPARPGAAFLGVASQTAVTYTLPFNVSIQVGDIGGPSAGLALTLGLLDVLSNGQLTGGHAVAATGTIAPDGTVGDVGGVAQKTIAVKRAGAQVFLVPPQEYATAKSHAGSGLQVLAVSTLDEALTDLQHLGGTLGQLATPPASSSTTTP